MYNVPGAVCQSENDCNKIKNEYNNLWHGMILHLLVYSFYLKTHFRFANW